jgi:hypothetical protein
LTRLARVLPAVALFALAACGGGEAKPTATSAPPAPSTTAPSSAASGSATPAEAGARHRDTKAGLDYPVPGGWFGPYTEDLALLTSAVQSVAMTEDGDDDPDSFGLVGAGRFQDTFYDPSREGIGKASMSTAIGFAEFFVPVAGKRDILLDKAERVGDRDGWRVRFRVTPNDPSEAEPATFELVGVSGKNPGFVIGFVTGTDAETLRTMQAALADVRLA